LLHGGGKALEGAKDNKPWRLSPSPPLSMADSPALCFLTCLFLLPSDLWPFPRSLTIHLLKPNRIAWPGMEAEQGFFAGSPCSTPGLHRSAQGKVAETGNRAASHLERRKWQSWYSQGAWSKCPPEVAELGATWQARLLLVCGRTIPRLRCLTAWLGSFWLSLRNEVTVLLTFSAFTVLWMLLSGFYSILCAVYLCAFMASALKKILCLICFPNLKQTKTLPFPWAYFTHL
jgi:hypothetical protein